MADQSAGLTRLSCISRRWTAAYSATAFASAGGDAPDLSVTPDILILVEVPARKTRLSNIRSEA